MAEPEESSEPHGIEVEDVPASVAEEAPSLPIDDRSIAFADEAPTQSRESTRSPPIVRARAVRLGGNAPVGYERSYDSVATDASLTSSVFSIDFGEGAGVRASGKRVSQKMKSGIRLTLQDSALFTEVDLLRRQVRPTLSLTNATS